MDRTPYLIPFTRARVPPWRCPMCQIGVLTLEPSELMAAETARSVRDRKHDEWEPDWIRYVFSCVFRCNHASCREPVSCTGVGKVGTHEYENEDFEWVQATEDIFTPMYFHPSLILMDFPDQTPATTGIHLEESFALFFADPGAALNSARAAVEALLTRLGIKRFIVAKGKRRSISLHQRILLLPPKYKDLAELLIAVKWLGNAGSHDESTPTTSDVRVTYDLLEHVLSEIYEGKAKKLEAVARKVNKKKGPAK